MCSKACRAKVGTGFCEKDTAYNKEINPDSPDELPI